MGRRADRRQQTDDPVHLKYHQANKRKGCYIGEVVLQLEYKGERGPFLVGYILILKL